MLKENEALTRFESEILTFDYNSQLPVKQVAELVAAFESYVTGYKELEEEARSLIVTSEDDEEGMSRAKRLRLDIRKFRTGAEKERKKQKKYSLLIGNLVQEISSLIQGPIKAIEDHLEEQELFAARRQEERDQELLLARKELLRPYVEERLIDTYPGLKEMTDEQFQRQLVVEKAAFAARAEKARQEAIDRQSKEDEIVEHQRRENIRLMEEAEQARRDKIEAEKRAAEAQKEANQLKLEAQLNKHPDEIDPYDQGQFELAQKILEEFEVSNELKDFLEDIVGVAI